MEKAAPSSLQALPGGIRAPQRRDTVRVCSSSALSGSLVSLSGRTSAKFRAPAIVTSSRFSTLIPPMTYRRADRSDRQQLAHARKTDGGIGQALCGRRKHRRRCRRSRRPARKRTGSGRGCASTPPTMARSPTSARTSAYDMSSCPTCTPSAPMSAASRGIVVDDELRVLTLP